MCAPEPGKYLKEFYLACIDDPQDAVVAK